MIQMNSNPISMYYRGRVIQSWWERGYDVQFYEATTPENNQKTYLNFDKKRGTIEFTPTEKAVWYSHVEMWAKARERPILIIEHDAMLLSDIPSGIFKEPMACLGHGISPTTGHRHKLAGCAYWLTPKIATKMVSTIKTMKRIQTNSDAFIHSNCDREGVWAKHHVQQIQEDDVGTTIEHLRK